ncbi:hypothetical protein G3578_09895 [Brevibacillus sp. SYP-B805]|uniref:hypothetical protein n=1 Tax=Brevibacillus sp. SYP-B805 TaxID=1578199 RepID=UPI0013EC7ABC|nr:hypothetical protein [Brevibacillus sp. SYP-B805]NGQ95465.1 hypothetical protein [Brevibacillus sp. SYP-B805]
MKDSLAFVVAVILAVAIWFATVSLTAWLVSILVEFLFEVEFGFWKAFASVVLIDVFSNLVFSGMPRVTKQ